MMNDMLIPEQCRECKLLKFCYDCRCLKEKPCRERVEQIRQEDVEIRGYKDGKGA